MYFFGPLRLQNSLNSQIAKGSETGLEPSRTYMVELSTYIVELLAVSFFVKKAPSLMFDWVLNTFLRLSGESPVSYRFRKYLLAIEFPNFFLLTKVTFVVQNFSDI